MRVKVLGSAAGGGFPQWNCGCANCNRLRAGVFKGRARMQAQVGVSPTPGKWFLLNASPDLRQQLLDNPEFAPVEETRSTPIVGIFLTSADADCVMGLLHLREFQPLTIYSTAAVRRVVAEENSLFRTLERSKPAVRWETLEIGKQVHLFQPPQFPEEFAGVSSGVETPGEKAVLMSELKLRPPENSISSANCAAAGGEGLSCRAVPVGGGFPDYVSDALREKLRADEATIALEFTEGGKRFFYAPNLPGRSEEWKRPAMESDLSLMDGTFWTDDELVRVRGSGKTAREMGHLPLSGANGLLEQMSVARGHEDARDSRRVLIHMNNTNPVLDEESAASRTVREAGWEIAWDGMEIEL